MLGIKQFERAAITITGIELPEKIRKQQFRLGSCREDLEPFQTFG